MAAAVTVSDSARALRLEQLDKRVEKHTRLCGSPIEGLYILVVAYFVLGHFGTWEQR